MYLIFIRIEWQFPERFNMLEVATVMDFFSQTDGKNAFFKHFFRLKAKGNYEWKRFNAKIKLGKLYG